MIFFKAHNTQINCFCIVEMLYNPLLRICLFFLLQNCFLLSGVIHKNIVPSISCSV